jgi:hypothetical protein
MLPYLVETMRRLNLDEQAFFRLAHIWAFDKDAPVATEVCQFKLHGVVPPFVVSYVKHIQGET